MLRLGASSTTVYAEFNRQDYVFMRSMIPPSGEPLHQWAVASDADLFFFLFSEMTHLLTKVHGYGIALRS